MAGAIKSSPAQDGGGIRAMLEAAMAQQQAKGAPGGPPQPGADADGDGDDQPGQGPVTRDAFSFEQQANGQDTCGTCQFFEDDESGCGLYDKLNTAMPDIFSLDPKVDPGSLCKAHVDVSGGAGGDEQPPGAPPAPPSAPPASPPGAPPAPQQ